MAVGFTIGKLARLTGLNPKTIRYYEQVGLVPAPARARSGYRIYGDDAVRRLTLIRRCRLIGLSLKETRQLVELALDHTCSTFQGRLLELVAAKLDEVDRQIEELAAFKQDLSRYRVTLENSIASPPLEEQPVMACTPCACTNETISLKILPTRS